MLTRPNMMIAHTGCTKPPGERQMLVHGKRPHPESGGEITTFQCSGCHTQIEILIWYELAADVSEGEGARVTVH